MTATSLSDVLELRGKLLRVGRDPADLKIEILPEA